MSGAEHKVALVLSYQYPGKYAFTVLAGAIEAGSGVGGRAHPLPSGSRDAAGHAAPVRGRGLHGGGGVVVLLGELRRGGGGAGLGARAARRAAGALHRGRRARHGGDGADAAAGFELVAVGEGESLLRELLHRLKRGEDPKGTRGLARLEEGRVVQNGRGEGVVDLDAFPPFAAGHEKFGAIEITRGCIYACRFCQTPFMSKARFRHRSVRNVAEWARVLRQLGAAGHPLHHAHLAVLRLGGRVGEPGGGGGAAGGAPGVDGAGRADLLRHVPLGGAAGARDAGVAARCSSGTWTTTT